MAQGPWVKDGLLALLLVLRPMVLRLTTLQPLLAAPGGGGGMPFTALPGISGDGAPLLRAVR